jgi:hypothetical protein
VWHEAHRRLDETYDASCAANDRVRARCPVPQALIATESDAGFWGDAVVGRLYQENDVARLRVWAARRYGEAIYSERGVDDRAEEIVAAWDRWRPDLKAAKEREGVATADALWGQAIEDYHASGNRLARYRAKTMAGIIAKLLAAVHAVTEDDLEDDNNSYAAVLAGAALDAQALLNPRGEEVRS